MDNLPSRSSFLELCSDRDWRPHLLGLLRLDREEDGAIGPELARVVRATIEERLDGCDGVILEDYDKGLFADGIGRFTIELARQRGLRVVADPKTDLRRFRGASLVKPNLEEAMRFVGSFATVVD